MREPQRCIRVSDREWRQWKAKSKKARRSLASLIRARMNESFTPKDYEPKER